MKENIFSVFITFLGLFTAYVFYTLWHTEEVSPPPITKNSKEKIVEDLSNKNIIPKKNIHKNTFKPVFENSLEIKTEIIDEEKIREKMEQEIIISKHTPEEIEAQVQEVYESLKPDDYEETMEEASIVFEELDTYVEKIDNTLIKEIQENYVSEVSNHENQEEIEEYKSMEVSENEAEINLEQEDINNQ